MFRSHSDTLKEVNQIGYIVTFKPNFSIVDMSDLTYVNSEGTSKPHNTRITFKSTIKINLIETIGGGSPGGREGEKWSQ